MFSFLRQYPSLLVILWLLSISLVLPSRVSGQTSTYTPRPTSTVTRTPAVTATSIAGTFTPAPTVTYSGTPYPDGCPINGVDRSEVSSFYEVQCYACIRNPAPTPVPYGTVVNIPTRIINTPNFGTPATIYYASSTPTRTPTRTPTVTPTYTFTPSLTPTSTGTVTVTPTPNTPFICSYDFEVSSLPSGWTVNIGSFVSNLGVFDANFASGGTNSDRLSVSLAWTGGRVITSVEVYHQYTKGTFTTPATSWALVANWLSTSAIDYGSPVLYGSGISTGGRIDTIPYDSDYRTNVSIDMRASSNASSIYDGLINLTGVTVYGLGVPICSASPTATPTPSNTPTATATITETPTDIPPGFFDCSRPDLYTEYENPDAFQFTTSIVVEESQCYRIIPYIDIQIDWLGVDLQHNGTDLCIDFYSLPTLRVFGIYIPLIQVVLGIVVFFIIHTLLGF